MKAKSLKRFLAAALALSMLFATTAGAYAEELEIKGTNSEVLTEEGSGELAGSEDGFVFEDQAEPAVAESADETSFYENGAAPTEDEDAGEAIAPAAIENESVGDAQDTAADDETDVMDADSKGNEADVQDDEAADVISEDSVSADESSLSEEASDEDGVIAEELTEEADVLSEEGEDGLSEEALGEGAAAELVPETEEDAVSELITEEAFGAFDPNPIFAKAHSGDYGDYFGFSSGIIPLDNSATLNLSAVIKEEQEKSLSMIFSKETPKSYKVIKAIDANGDVKKAVSISKKGVATAKKPAVVLVAAYDKNKKPICCTVLWVMIYQKKTGLKYLTHKLNGANIFDYVECKYPGEPDPVIVSGEDEYNEMEMNPRFSYKSSKSKCLSIDSNGMMTTGKNGTTTITVTFSDKGKESLKSCYNPTCKIKLKLKVKIASVKEITKIKPGKTCTIKVKNACADNMVGTVNFLPGDHFTVISQTGKYHEKIKVKASEDGGSALFTIDMLNGTGVSGGVYSLQTKIRVYTDAGAAGTLGSYDTKAADVLLKKVNAERAKNGKAKLKSHGWLTAFVAMDARGAVASPGRISFESREKLLLELPADLISADADLVGIAVFYDETAKTYYLSYGATKKE